MIHGLPNGYGWLGKSHFADDWTDGCIAVTNEEMDEIWRAVANGTPIEFWCLSAIVPVTIHTAADLLRASTIQFFVGPA
jgi:hypothetical protein